MFAPNHLSLQEARIKPQEGWICSGKGCFFVFFKGGVGEYVSGGARQLVQPGDILVANDPPGGTLRVAGHGEVTFAFFRASLEAMFPLFEAREIGRFLAGAERFKTGRIYSSGTLTAIKCHRLLLETPPPPSLEHRSHLLEVVAVILSCEFENAQPQPRYFIPSEERLSRLFREVSIQEVLGLSAEELAARLACSRRHLNRLFHRHLGLSVAEFKTSMRMFKAVSLLRNPRAKIIHVAEECGFNTLSWFNACFKARFGVSPAQWRSTASSAIRGSAGFEENPFDQGGLVGLCAG